MAAWARLQSVRMVWRVVASIQLDLSRRIRYARFHSPESAIPLPAFSDRDLFLVPNRHFTVRVLNILPLSIGHWFKGLAAARKG